MSMSMSILNLYSAEPLMRRYASKMRAAEFSVRL